MQNLSLADREAMILKTEEEICRDRPALVDVARPFSTLFRARARTADRLAGQNLAKLPVSRGLASLTAASFPGEASRQAAREMLAAAVEAFPALERSLAALERNLDGTDVAGLCKAFLTTEPSVVSRAAKTLDVTPDSLDMVIRLTLSALLSGLADGEGPGFVSGINGHCPVCGSLPTMSFLQRPSDDQSEFLQGGGGNRMLHCFLCGHNWSIRRMVCPVCGTDDPRHLRYYAPDERSGQRVDACLPCKIYLPCLDLRKTEGIPDMDMAAVGMIYLDILVQERGFFPLTHTLWNKIL